MFTATLIGNLGNEPSSRQLTNGQVVCNFDVASNRVYNDAQGQPVKETTWFTVAVWGTQAANCQQYLHQGSQVAIQFSRFVIDPQTGGPRVFARNNGEAGSKLEITADRVYFLDSVATRQARGAQVSEETIEPVGYDEPQAPTAYTGATGVRQTWRAAQPQAPRGAAPRQTVQYRQPPQAQPADDGDIVF